VRLKNPTFAQASFLRAADARCKLALALAASASAMLPLVPLALVAAGYAVLLVAARAHVHAFGYLRRAGWLFAALFALDWAFIGVDFALLITLRLFLLICAFSALLATTSPEELSEALEWLGLSRRFAFAFVTSLRSTELIESEWRGIVEAQRARGLGLDETAATTGWRQRVRGFVPLVVPAVVLATQRAWALHESAALRGFESPHPRRCCRGALGGVDYALLVAAAALVMAPFWS
jgi:energy-coupling factor transporter transmembrane protein EcfT